MKKIEIYTDGSCLGNPGKGGYAAILKYGQYTKELSGGERETTNNRMEIMSVIAALEALNQPCEAELYTDSQYVVNAINEGWAVRWRSMGWMRNKKEPALNSDLWEKLLQLLSVHKIKFNWVRGHSGHKYNERCDELARNFAASV